MDAVTACQTFTNCHLKTDQEILNWQSRGIGEYCYPNTDRLLLLLSYYFSPGDVYIYVSNRS
jgi:hypothetical protein